MISCTLSPSPSPNPNRISTLALSLWPYCIPSPSPVTLTAARRERQASRVHLNLLHGLPLEVSGCRVGRSKKQVLGQLVCEYVKMCHILDGSRTSQRNTGWLSCFLPILACLLTHSLLLARILTHLRPMHRDERNFSILFDDAHFLETEVLVCNAGQHAIRSLDDDGNPIAQEDDPTQHRVRLLSRRLAASSASSGSSSQSGDASGDEETLTRRLVLLTITLSPAALYV
jgi:hypothetical protein